MFISVFLITLISVQQLFMLGSTNQEKRKRSREQRADEVVCGRNGCRNIELRPIFESSKGKKELGKTPDEPHVETHLEPQEMLAPQVKVNKRRLTTTTTAKKATSSKKPLKKQRKSDEEEKEELYLLPIMFYNMGPNNLFRILKEVVSLTTILNRTMVIPPFPHHPRMENQPAYDGANDSNSDIMMSVDIFDQSYKSVVETDADKVVDVQLLAKLLPLSSYKRFKKDCGNKVSTLLTCGKIIGKRTDGLNDFHEATGIYLGRNYQIDQVTDDDLHSSFSLNLINAIRSTKHEKCIGLALGTKCFGSRKAWLKFWTPQAPFFQRPTIIKDLARSFILNKFNDEPYLAVHWRFENMDWLDMCKLSRPSAVRKLNRPICDLVEQIVYNKTFIDHIAVKIEAHMREKSLKYLYFAAPPQLNTALQHLQTKITSMFYSKNVQEFAASNHGGRWSQVFNDNFAASFLDQELCYKSRLFLGSPLSSWTQTVMLDRVSLGLFDYHSLFDVILEDNSRFPKLTWYFPEGM